MSSSISKWEVTVLPHYVVLLIFVGVKTALWQPGWVMRPLDLGDSRLGKMTLDAIYQAAQATEKNVLNAAMGIENVVDAAIDWIPPSDLSPMRRRPPDGHISLLTYGLGLVLAVHKMAFRWHF